MNVWRAISWNPFVCLRRRVLALAGLTVFLAGCEPPAEPLSTTQLSALFRTAQEDPATHLDIDYQGSPYAEGGRTGSWIQKRFEARYNVTLHVNFIPTFSYDKLLSFRLIGGEIPDVFWLRDARELKKAVEQGFVQEVPYEVIVQYAPDYVRLMRRISPDAWLLSLANDRNYGLPTFNITQATYPSPGIWNKTWLDRVGIHKIPETLAEMEEALRRFRYNDPDGNGQRDTYGMCAWKPGVSAGTLDRSFEEIFGAFGVIPNGWMRRDGRVVWGGTLPECKEALAILHRWYAEGLILPDYMTLPIGNLSVRQQLLAGKVGYIMGFNLNGWSLFDHRIPSALAVIHAAVHPGEELVPAFLPIGPRGQRGVHTWGGSVGGIMVFGPQVLHSPEKLFRMLRYFNELARDPEFYVEQRTGKRGLHWEWDSYFGMKKIPPYDIRAFAAPELLGEGPLIGVGDSFGYFAPFAPPPELVERLTPSHARDFINTYQRPEWGIKDELLMAETVPSSSKYLLDLVQLQAIAFTEIITGHRPLESFDDFVAAWRRQGGDLLTNEANALYRQKELIRERIDTLVPAPKS